MIGGTRGHRPAAADQRRFFQYQYELRLSAKTCSARTCSIPARRSPTGCRAASNRTLRRRAATRLTLLPRSSVRVLSLVPADATDIRDAPAETFDDHRVAAVPRPNVFASLAIVLFAAGGALLVGAGGCGSCGSAGRRSRARHVVVSDRRSPAGRRHASSPPLQQARQGEGWTTGYAARVRGAAGRRRLALGRPVGQWPAEPPLDGREGQLVLRGLALRQKACLVSGVGHPGRDPPRAGRRRRQQPRRTAKVLEALRKRRSRGSRAAVRDRRRAATAPGAGRSAGTRLRASLRRLKVDTSGR